MDSVELCISNILYKINQMHEVDEYISSLRIRTIQRILKYLTNIIIVNEEESHSTSPLLFQDRLS